MALTNKDIQMIKKIVDKNMYKYMSGKPYILSITYDELEKEIIKVYDDLPDIPIMKLE